MDDFEQLWKSGLAEPGMKGEEMREIVLGRMAAFDRRIRIRNRIETLAALAVTAVFGVAASVQKTPLERLGSGMIAASGLWIAWYIRRHGMDESEPDAAQAVSDYRLDLARKYDYQIRLLRRVKFWYLLPMYVGLLVSTAGIVLKQNRPLRWFDAIAPLFYTVVFAAVWWLNEVGAVRKLRDQRNELKSD